MTTPYECTRALVGTSDFLQRLATRGDVAAPISLAIEAEALLRHYPPLTKIELAHRALPMFFGPVSPFSQLVRTADVPVDPAETWWQQEIWMLQMLRTKELLDTASMRQLSEANERYLNLLTGICVGGMLFCLAVAVYAMKYLK